MTYGSVTREWVFAAAADERRAIADLVGNLTPDQLATPSLCVGWDVKTVVAHLISDFDDGFSGFLRSGIRRGGINRGIDALARQRAQAPTAELVNTLRSRADERLSPPVVGPRAGLADLLIHGADIRLPLGIADAPDSERVVAVMDFLTGRTGTVFVSRKGLRGIALHDDDSGRSWGDGDAVHGPGWAIMLAVCGRAVALAHLDGPGLDLLTSRIT